MNKIHKYHMVKWDDLCLPKDMCGLGILASLRMNVALVLSRASQIILGEGDYGCSLFRQSTFGATAWRVPVLAVDLQDQT